MGSSRPDGAPSSDGSSVSQISVATAHTSIDTNDGNTSSETDIDAHDQEDSHAEDTLSPETVRQQHNGVIRRLIEIFPLAMRNQHNLWGWTPLHMACYSSRSDAQTVRALVKAYPGACSMRDRQRLLPLHRACLMASQEVDDIVRALLLTDPSQVSTEIRNEDRDVPFHLVMARIHHEIQKLKFKPLRQKQQHDHQDHQDQAQSTDEANTWPFHEAHPQLEKLIEATFLILEADINGTIDTGYLTTQQKLRLLNHCMHQTRCPNHRLFVYMALWEHPELVMMGDAYADGNNNVMLHIAAKHTKREVADCHWCSTCNRGLADPHFVSQDSGESCDLNCAYKQRGGSGTRQEGVAKSWYGRYKNRMYKDVVLTTPYGCILKQITNLYPQAAAKLSDDGKFPLHIAISSGHSWIPGVQAIYRAYPHAGRVRDPETGLFPFQLSAMKKHGPKDDAEWERKRHLSELTTAFELLRRDPDIITKL